MKYMIVFAIVVATIALVSPASAEAYYYTYTQPVYYQYVPTHQYTYSTPNYGGSTSNHDLAEHLRRLIADLQSQLNARQTQTYVYKSPTYTYYQSGSYYNPNLGHSQNYVVGDPRSRGDKHRDDRYDTPDVTTNNATNIGRSEARLRGQVRMNDYTRGEAFFVYGTDRGFIENVEDDADSYSDVSTRGDRLSKVRVSSNVSGNRSFDTSVSGLTRDEDYYFRMCVGYENDRGRDTLACGHTVRFTTDR